VRRVVSKHGGATSGRRRNAVGEVGECTGE